MNIREENKEVIERMTKYAGSVSFKGIDKDLYNIKLEHAYALYDVTREDWVHAINILFDYAFSKGIQAERNRMKRAKKGEN